MRDAYEYVGLILYFKWIHGAKNYDEALSSLKESYNIRYDSSINGKYEVVAFRKC